MKNKIIKIGLAFCIFFLILSGLLLFGSTFLPYKFLKIILTSISTDDNLGKLTKLFFENLIIRFRTGGIGIFFISVFLFIYRKKIETYVSYVFTSAVLFYRDLAAFFRKIVSDDDKMHIWLLMTILAAAIVIRTIFLFRPMRMDECYTFTAYASFPIYRAISYDYCPNNHLLNTLLTHVSYLIFGNNPWAVRLPAFLAGVILVPISYITARILYNKYAGLLTSALIAFSTVFISYSTNSRGYTMLCLFFMLVICLGAYLTKHINAFAWLIFCVFSALGFYSIPIMLIPFGIVIIWLLLSIIVKRNSPEFKYRFIKYLVISALVTISMTLILYLPVIMVSGPKAIFQNNSFFSIPQHFPNFVLAWNDWNYAVPFLIKILLIAGFLISIIFHSRLTNYRVSFIAPIIIWLIFILPTQRPTDYSRIWLFLLPLYFMMVSSGVSYLIKGSYRIARPLFIIGLSCALLFNIISTNSVYYFCNARERTLNDAEEISIFLKNHLRKGDSIFAVSRTIIILKYYFLKYHIPKDFWNNDIDKSDRIFIVTLNQDYGALESLLHELKLSWKGYEKPRLMRVFSQSVLYEVNRIKDRDTFAKISIHC